MKLEHLRTFPAAALSCAADLLIRLLSGDSVPFESWKSRSPYTIRLSDIQITSEDIAIEVHNNLGSWARIVISHAHDILFFEGSCGPYSYCYEEGMIDVRRCDSNDDDSAPLASRTFVPQIAAWGRLNDITLSRRVIATDEAAKGGENEKHN